MFRTHSAHMLAFINASYCASQRILRATHCSSQSGGFVGSVIHFPLIFWYLSSSRWLASGPEIQTNEKTRTAPDKLAVSGRSDEPSGRPERTWSSGGVCVCVCVIPLLMIRRPHSRSETVKLQKKSAINPSVTNWRCSISIFVYVSRLTRGSRSCFRDFFSAVDGHAVDSYRAKSLARWCVFKKFWSLSE